MAEESTGTIADGMKAYDYDDPGGADVRPKRAEESKPAEAPSFPEPQDPALGESLSKDDATPPSGDGFDESLLIAASNLGFSEDEAKSFGTPESLRKVMNVLESRISDFTKEAEQARQATQPAELQQPVEELEVPEFKELDPDDYGDLSEAIKGRDEFLVKTAKTQQERIKRLEDALLQQQAQAVEQQFDSAIEKLVEDDPHFRTVYGQGSTLRLPDGGLHQKNRHEVARKIKEWADAAYRGGGSPDPIEKLVSGAARYLHGLSPKEEARREIEGKLKKQESQVGQPPTQHKGSDKPRGRDRAVSGLTELMKQKGWGPFAY